MGLKRGSQRTIDKCISSFVGFKIVIFLDQASRMNVCVEETLLLQETKKGRKAWSECYKSSTSLCWILNIKYHKITQKLPIYLKVHISSQAQLKVP